MNLQIVPARAGLKWVRQGMRTFWRQPLALSGLFFLFMATVSIVSIVPFIGSALALIILPALTLGMMAATQTATEGKFPMPSVLFTAFKAGPHRQAMFHLGGLYALIDQGPDLDRFIKTLIDQNRRNQTGRNSPCVGG